LRAFLVCVLFVVMFATPHSSQAVDETITIGVLTSISDEWAVMGTATVRGVELAIAEVNGRGGVHGRKLQLLVEDTREAHSGGHAVTAYRSLRQRNVKWLIGPAGTGAAIALAPIAAADQVIVISPTIGVSEFSSAGANIFNVRGVDRHATEYMAREAFKAGWRRVAVLASQQPWDTAQGEAFASEFTRLGGVVVSRESPLSDANDFQTMLVRALATKPDGMFLSHFSRIGVIGKQLKRLGYTGPKFSTLLDPAAVESASGSLDGTEFANFAGPRGSFISTFQATYNVEPGLGSDTAYDAVLALAKALDESEDEGVATVSKKLSTVSFDGAAGVVTFDRDRIAVRQVKRFIVRHGRIEESRPAE
jgi:branched-chain amino acid transport system substrate-binding protein